MPDPSDLSYDPPNLFLNNSVPLKQILYSFLDKRKRYNYNVIMEAISFEWDEKKNASNKKKHGVSFEEGQTVFVDENALMIHDPDHSDEEERFIMLGLSARLRVLVVCHSYRKNQASIRIISARRATRLEQKQYWERWAK